MMYTLLAATALLARIAVVSANGQGESPEGTLMYNTTTFGSNSTPSTIDYDNYGTKMTLNNTYATSFWIGGGNEAWDAGITCLFQSGGNPGGLHTISTGQTANLATTEVQIYWVCCGDCDSYNTTNGTAVGSNNGTASAASTATGAALTSTMTNGASTSNTSAGVRGNCCLELFHRRPCEHKRCEDLCGFLVIGHDVRAAMRVRHWALSVCREKLTG